MTDGTATGSSSSLRARLGLYLVMGSVNCKQDPVRVVDQAIRGGITAFQFREKGLGALSGQIAFELGRELRRLCKAHNVLFLVNDDVELALRLDADGVHVGQEDEAAAEVRAKLPGRIVGVSAHDVPEAAAAIRHGADYLGVGPMYPTSTKPDARAVQGPGIIRDMRRHGIAVPIVGIGGIGPGRAQPVVAAGADGVAVVSAISQAASPKLEAERLIQEIRG